MFHIIMYEPEIPPNTGNVIRLCANTGASLHLVEPLGFSLDEPRLRRAGLDYHEYASVHVHQSLPDALEALGRPRVLAFTAHGAVPLASVHFAPGDALLFGPETRGLPEAVLGTVPEACRVRIPMLPGRRSLNLSNAVSVALYEAWRHTGYAGGE